MVKILGIETSCDETAVAIVDIDGKILSHEIFSQIEQHSVYGGVVPELASRAHMEKLEYLIVSSMQKAGMVDEGGKLDFKQLTAIAVTAGPGLIGGVIVGVMMAKAIAAAANLPIIPINHLEGHALTARMVDKNIEFPFLLLLVSGGHCQLLQVLGVGEYKLLGATLDDALGETFDKVAKMLKLGYPGGREVEQLAKAGNVNAYKFPRALIDRPNCDFSFSGIKTAVRNQIAAADVSQDGVKADICASFQQCVTEILLAKVGLAIKLCKGEDKPIKQVVLAGGVAANNYIRSALTALCRDHGLEFKVAPMDLCTDNAAMIAWAGIENYLKYQAANDFNERFSDLSFAPKARWGLSDG